MNIRIDIHIHPGSGEPAPDLKTILAAIEGLKTTLMDANTALTDLQAQVAAETTVTASAITLINGIPALLAAQGVSPDQVEAVAQSLKTQSDALAAAVTANTPAAPAPAPGT